MRSYDSQPLPYQTLPQSLNVAEAELFVYLLTVVLCAGHLLSGWLWAVVTEVLSVIMFSVLIKSENHERFCKLSKQSSSIHSREMYSTIKQIKKVNGFIFSHSLAQHICCWGQRSSVQWFQLVLTVFSRNRERKATGGERVTWGENELSSC